MECLVVVVVVVDAVVVTVVRVRKSIASTVVGIAGIAPQTCELARILRFTLISEDALRSERLPRLGSTKEKKKKGEAREGATDKDEIRHQAKQAEQAKNEEERIDKETPARGTRNTGK